MKRTAILAAILGMAVCAQAQASFTINSSVGGAAAGALKWNFDSLPLGAAGGTNGFVTVALTPNAMVVNGSVMNMYAAPFLSGTNGNGFGPGNTTQANGVDTTNYITTGSDGAVAGAAVTITFATPVKYLGLLWGSVDAYNTLTFYSGATLVGTVTGTQVLASANGNQGSNGTVYVNLNSSLSFDRVVATSTQYALEFDNLAYNKGNIVVPEPAAIALFGLGLVGLGIARRRAK